MLHPDNFVRPEDCTVIKTDQLIHIVMQIMTQDFVFLPLLEYLKLMTELTVAEIVEDSSFCSLVSACTDIQQGENG